MGQACFVYSCLLRLSPSPQAARSQDPQITSMTLFLTAGRTRLSSFKHLGEGKDFNGGRDFDGLKKFVTETLERKCQVADPAGCNDKEKKFIDLRKAKDKAANDKELERLTKMAAGSSMKAELKQWLHQRLNILKQL